MRHKANLKGKRVNIVNGENWGNAAILRYEVPDMKGMVSVSIEDIILSVPVGNLSPSRMPVTFAHAAISALGRREWVIEKDLETYMKNVFMTTLPSSLIRIWSLAYFVTEENALDVAESILQETGYNVQAFAFKELEKALKEYHSLGLEKNPD